MIQLVTFYPKHLLVVNYFVDNTVTSNLFVVDTHTHTPRRPKRWESRPNLFLSTRANQT